MDADAVNAVFLEGPPVIPTCQIPGVFMHSPQHQRTILSSRTKDGGMKTCKIGLENNHTTFFGKYCVHTFSSYLRHLQCLNNEPAALVRKSWLYICLVFLADPLGRHIDCATKTQKEDTSRYFNIQGRGRSSNSTVANRQINRGGVQVESAVEQTEGEKTSEKGEGKKTWRENRQR